jgi:hypothetical protein
MFNWFQRTLHIGVVTAMHIDLVHFTKGTNLSRSKIQFYESLHFGQKISIPYINILVPRHLIKSRYIYKLIWAFTADVF